MLCPKSFSSPLVSLQNHYTTTLLAIFIKNVKKANYPFYPSMAGETCTRPGFRTVPTWKTRGDDIRHRINQHNNAATESGGIKRKIRGGNGWIFQAKDWLSRRFFRRLRPVLVCRFRVGDSFSLPSKMRKNTKKSGKSSCIFRETDIYWVKQNCVSRQNDLKMLCRQSQNIHHNQPNQQ